APLRSSALKDSDADALGQRRSIRRRVQPSRADARRTSRTGLAPRGKLAAAHRKGLAAEGRNLVRRRCRRPPAAPGEKARAPLTGAELAEVRGGWNTPRPASTDDPSPSLSERRTNMTTTSSRPWLTPYAYTCLVHE